MNLCINTSVSALDSVPRIDHRLKQFYRLKSVCNSILRIVSCDFNKRNDEGFLRSVIQEKLFKHNRHIDTIFRPSANNPFVVRNIIKTEKTKFLKGYVLASVFDKKTHFGKCSDCPDMCGINVI